MKKDTLEALANIVGQDHCLTDDGAVAPFVNDWRRLYRGRALAVLLPGSVAEVRAIIALSREQGLAIVPQGGNTGLAGAATPDDSGRAIVVSLRRLNRIRGVDPANNSIEVEAGCLLVQVQDAAAAAGRFFPLSLGAEGSCTIGGNLATNAGGINVLKYGTARDLVLGIEVVLPDGNLLGDIKTLRKDNTGYDLKQLFIGSEGTLGIITAATLTLFPRLERRATAIAASRPSMPRLVCWRACAPAPMTGS
jgi:FAD/FMN-containing dehydrogenase